MDSRTSPGKEIQESKRFFFESRVLDRAFPEIHEELLMSEIPREERPSPFLCDHART
jgi:hypothetical protein